METLCLLGTAAFRAPEGALSRLRLRPKGLALLAWLALESGPHARHDLAELLFPTSEDPRAELRWYINHLRRVLPGALPAGLVVSDGTLEFRGPTDVAEFRCLGQPDLFRGDLCADVRISVSARFDTWLCIEQESLRTLYRRRVLDAAANASDGPARERAAALLSGVISVDPYCEDAHIALVEVLESLGRPGPGAVARERYQRMVREELGTEPRLADGRSLPKEDFVPAGEVTLHVVEWEGRDPPVIALHGSGMSAYSLAALAERVAPQRRFIAVDLRGHGLSDKPKSGYQLSALAGDVAGLIGALGGSPPVLAGFSIGGAVAALAAARRPVSGLVLLDAVVGDRQLVRRCAGAVPQIGAGVDARYAGIDDYIAAWTVPGGSTRYARLELSPMPDGSFRRRALRTALEEMWDSALETETLAPLASIGCPVLVVNARLPWLGDEVYIPPAAARRQAAAPGRGLLVDAPDRNHPGIVRSPEPVMVDALRRFLAGL